VNTDIQEVKKTIPSYLKIGAVVTILLIGCAIGAKPLLRYVYAKRFAHSLTEAKQSFDSGNQQQAKEKLLLAWQVSNKKVAQLRQLLEVSRLIQSEESAVIAHHLFTSVEASALDRTKALEVLSQLGSETIFEPLYQSLPDSEKELTANRIARARYFYASEQLDAAIQEVEKAAANPKDHSAHLALIDLLLNKEKSSYSEEDFDRAQTRIAEVARILIESSDRQTAIAGIHRVIALHEPLKFFRYPELERWVNERDQNNQLIKERLFFLSLRINEMPESNRNEAIDKTFDQYKESCPDELVTWLVNMNAEDRMERLSPEARSKSLTVYYAYLQFLVEKEKWTDAKEWLAKAPQKADRVIIEATLAAIAFKENDNTKNFHHQVRAFQAASFEGKSANFFAILSIAESVGDINTARRAAEAISEAPTLALPATEELKRLDPYLSNKPEKLLSFYAKLYASRENDPVATVKYAQLLVIVGEDIPRARKTIQSELENPRTRHLFLCTEALCYFAEGDEKAALAIIEKSGLKWDNPRSASDTAIYATILYKVGKADEAVALTSHIDWDKALILLKPYLLPSWKNESPLDSPKQ
jgi:hypothetical protein